MEMGEVQHFADVLGNLTELQISVHLARAGQGTHDGSQATAVDEHDFAKMENDGAAVAKEMGDMSAQGFDLAAGNDAAFAAHDRDPSNLACFQKQIQCVSNRMAPNGQQPSAPPCCARRP